MSSQRKECILCQLLYEVRGEKSLSDIALWKALVTGQRSFSGDCRGEEVQVRGLSGNRMVSRKADQEIFSRKDILVKTIWKEKS